MLFPAFYNYSLETVKTIQVCLPAQQSLFVAVAFSPIGYLRLKLLSLFV
jgi:hypothetical protein